MSHFRWWWGLKRSLRLFINNGWAVWSATFSIFIQVRRIHLIMNCVKLFWCSWIFQNPNWCVQRTRDKITAHCSTFTVISSLLWFKSRVIPNLSEANTDVNLEKKRHCMQLFNIIVTPSGSCVKQMYAACITKVSGDRIKSLILVWISRGCF